MELDFKVKWNCLYSHDHFLWIRWSLNSGVLKWLHLLNGIRRLVYCHSEWRSGCIDQICLSCTLNGHPPPQCPPFWAVSPLGALILLWAATAGAGMLLSFVIQNEVAWPAALASLGNMLDLQDLRLHPRLKKSESSF